MFRMRKDQVLTPEKLGEFVQRARVENRRNRRLYDAYRGVYPILNQRKPEFKPNNRLVVNFAKYITDTFNGFFIGSPIKTTSDDEAAAQVMEEIQAKNDQDDNNAELSKMMSIFGHAFELYYVTDDKDIGITYVSPMESFMIYSDSVTEEPLFFVRFYRNADDEEVGTVSDSRNVYRFSANSGYQMDEGTPHGFDGVPATEFIENEDRLGLYETVLTLIDAYNKAISEKANDVDYFADAYLKVIGPKLDEGDLRNLRDQRIINLQSDIQGSAEVDFLSKPDADATQEHLLDTLERLIYQVAMVPNINDEHFGTSSGIAMQYKVLNTLNLFRAKQRKFESGMNRRWRLIFSNPVLIGRVKPDQWTSIRYRFTPNLPANALEEAQTVAQLSGIISRQTQLEHLSLVNNVTEELARIDKENEIDDLIPDFNGHDHGTDDE